MDKYEVLKKYYGYHSFRTGQEVLIEGILCGRDAFGIMPTGAGKSVCYQVPALMMSGITIVVSPLISLMKDQVRALNEAGIHAAYINSSLTENQVVKALANAKNGRYKIVYAAPERLLTPRFLDFAMNVPISMITVDEAHCISQWGQDFRPSYRSILELVEQLPKRPVVSAFTATATDVVQSDIMNILQLRNPVHIVTGYDRKNLYFEVVQSNKKDGLIIDYIKRHEDESGIIYCSTRKNVEKVYDILVRQGISVTKYHAGLDAEVRKKNQDDFIYDEKKIVVATNAFGMGIDKSNVRYVLHYNMPQSMENYYQEAGRAGRDGEAAECILFYSPQDVVINRFLIDNREVRADLTPQEDVRLKERDHERLKQMAFYAKGKYCLRRNILFYFGEQAPYKCNNCSNCLSSHVVNMDYEDQYRTNVFTIYEDNNKSNSYFSYTQKSNKSNKSSKSKELSIQVPQGEKKVLYDDLRKLRLKLARTKGVPPYIIFSDKTLADMCTKLPSNKAEMMEVVGVGENKYDMYGEKFLKVIKQYS